MFSAPIIESLEIAKWAFVLLFVLSTVGVLVGVYWEGDTFEKTKQHEGRKLLLLSLAAETLFGIFIFGIDGWISQIQRLEIIELETKLAPRVLSDDEVEEIAAPLKKFAGQEFTIGSYGGEAAQIAWRIRAVLERADWKWFEPQFQIMPLAGTVGVQIWAQSEGSAREAAKTLVALLKTKFIEAALLPDQPAIANEKRIEIIVGSKF